MKFSVSVLALAAIASGPLVSNAFSSNSRAFVSTRIATNNVNNVASHNDNCSCMTCVSRTALFMSEEAAAEAVPDEVAALDGVASSEEAHNAERPARDSGIKKHKKGKSAGTPVGELEINSFVDGTVKSITSYGAFVDIGAATDALLHVSRLSDEFVSNVEDVVKAGDAVSVRIVSVDAAKGQVAISMLTEEAEAKVNEARNNRGSGGRRKDRPQRSQGDRGAQVATLNALAEAGFDQAKFVEGEVVSTLAFGAFVRFGVAGLAEGVEGELDGLVHISALAAGRTNSVEDVCNVGDKVQVRVRNIDTEGNKVSLSMITVEDEAANKPQRGKPRRRGRAMFNEDEMGAADWKESLIAFDKDTNPTFTNMPLIEDKRKTTA
jgi:predicted RNA-binding protein with RPS1 domain